MNRTEMNDLFEKAYETSEYEKYIPFLVREHSKEFIIEKIVSLGVPREALKVDIIYQSIQIEYYGEPNKFLQRKGSGMISEFPGCCSWAIFHSYGGTDPEWALEICEKLAKSMFYRCMVLSVNCVERKEFFERLGYKEIHSNINLKSRHNVTMMIKELWE